MAESLHFTNKELSCPCCGKNNVTLELLAKLETMRAMLGRPIFISSGTRCEDHNLKVGGKKSSAHLTGEAVDIPYISKTEAYELVKLAVMNKLWGIGVYEKHIHIDNRRRQTKVLWHG